MDVRLDSASHQLYGQQDRVLLLVASTGWSNSHLSAWMEAPNSPRPLAPGPGSGNRDEDTEARSCADPRCRSG